MYTRTSLPMNSEKKSKCMPGRNLSLNSGKKSKSMQEQVYLCTAERKVNICRNKFTLEQRKEK